MNAIINTKQVEDLSRRSASIWWPLSELGYQTVIVGGAVRDCLLNRPVHDIDLATAAPLAVLRDQCDTIELGAAFGTIGVKTAYGVIQVSRFRTDGAYSDGRHPDSVAFSDRLEDDLARRDFTINAMAYDPTTYQLIDLFDGQADLASRTLRVVGNAHNRLTDDTLRVFRAYRFVSQLGLEIDGDTRAALQRLCPDLRLPAKERITSELNALCAGPFVANAIGLMVADGLYDRVFGQSKPTEPSPDFMTGPLPPKGGSSSHWWAYLVRGVTDWAERLAWSRAQRRAIDAVILQKY